MAGIGVRLNKLFEKRSIVTALAGMGYSTAVTITPMVVVMAAILLMEKLLGFYNLPYVTKEVFLCTTLYIFIFAMLAASPLGAVISKLMSDIIFEEKFGDIMPCYYTGLALNMVIAAVPGLAFVIHALAVGKVAPAVIMLGYIGYMVLVFVFYTMNYLSICKTYEKIMLFYLIGMALAVVLSLILRYAAGAAAEISMLISIDAGLCITGGLALAALRQYFGMCSRNYGRLIQYIGRFRKLTAANTLYALGLYVHNFVFWGSELGTHVLDTFVYAQSYDLASFIAMFTNISTSVIFMANVEMHFHKSYKEYSEAVIGGRYIDIEKTKNRMFGTLVNEIMSVVRVQFIISVVMYLVFSVVLDRFGFNGLVMTIYPVLAAAYFIVFIMYCSFIFLYYFEDVTGALRTALIFFIFTAAGSVIAAQFARMWYGSGLLAGALAGWTYAYFRLRWIEKNIDYHIFCRGSILKRKRARRPSGIAYLGKEQGR